MFQITILAAVQPNNASADTIRQKGFLEKFTAEVYEDALKVLFFMKRYILGIQLT